MLSKDVACRCAFLLHLHPPPFITPISQCACQRAVKQSGVTGVLEIKRGGKKERVIGLRDGFPRKQGQGTGREESGCLETARSPVDH